MGLLWGPGCCFGVPFGRWCPRLGLRSARAKAQLRRAVVRKPSGGPPPASNPNSRLRSQGSSAVGFDANHDKGRGDDNHWPGPPPAPRGASKHQQFDSGENVKNEPFAKTPSCCRDWYKIKRITQIDDFSYFFFANHNSRRGF